MGTEGIGTYLYRSLITFYVWLVPTRPYSANMFPGFIIVPYRILQLCLVVLLIMMVIKLWKNKSRVFQLMILAFMIPLCVNFVFVMTAPENVSSLCVYGVIMWFVGVVWMAENVIDDGKRALKSVVQKIVTGVLVACVALYVRYANDTYLKAELIKTQSISYMNTIATQIKQLEEYTSETPVVFIGENEDPTLDDIEELSHIRVNSYRDTRLYTSEEVMRRWVGFEPVVGDVEKYENSSVVRDMPSYPNYGSIKMVDGTVVVKMGDVKK